MKAVGIDIGTAFIASAQYNKNNIKANYVRDGFIIFPYIEQKVTMLKQSKVPYIIKQRPGTEKQDIYVLGNEAFDLAVLFSAELRRPLASGIISAKEKDTEFILKEIIRRVAGEGQQGDIAHYTVPANPVDKDFNITYHREMFKRFLTDLGYQATPLNEAMAVAYSELEDKDLTGLCCSFGAGMTNVALSYKGLEIFAFSVARGGDYIDKQVADSRGITVSDASAEKEKSTFDLLDPKDDVEEAITIFYRDMLEYVIGHISNAMEEHRRKIKLSDPLSFVVAGGTTMPKGFLKLLVNALKDNPLPIPVGKVWQPKNPVMSVCKGCLRSAQRGIEDDKHDGVKDISDGDNKKHAYPKAPKKEVKPEIPKERTQKEKREDEGRAEAINVGGFAEAIDLSK